jgi:hypothetical protein
MTNATPAVTRTVFEGVDLPAWLLGVGDGLPVAVEEGVPVLLGTLQPLSYVFPPSKFAPVWLLYANWISVFPSGLY